MTWTRRALASLIVLSCGLGASSSAHAQEESFTEQYGPLTTTIGVITTIGLTVYFVQGLTDRALDKAFEKVELYLREHPNEVREALATGAGVAVDDLASLLALAPSERDAMGMRLRHQRTHALALVGQPDRIDRQATLAFLRLALTDTQLAARL